jgi:hypothetical protein
MRKFLLTLTAGIITLGAASTAAQADWDDHRGAVVIRTPILRPPVIVAPAYRPVVYAPVVYTAPVFPAPVTVKVFPVHYDRYHHWHDWAAYRAY